MKKKELLSPVGNFESLKMAVYHGCDAVYLGGKRLAPVLLLPIFRMKK